MAQIDAYWQLRERMVDEQLVVRGISERRVLEAMRFVPRHRFVLQDAAELAYIDAPLPIGFRQTISQPYIVALMTQLLRLRGDEVVLEAGTGSGYQAAVLGRLAPGAAPKPPRPLLDQLAQGPPLARPFRALKGHRLELLPPFGFDFTCDRAAPV